MERILQNAPFTTTMQYLEDGVPVDPLTVTVGITREDGTVVVPAGTATSSGTGANPRTFNMSVANTALLDWLTVTWTSATKGVRVSQLQVVGGFLFTIPQLRAKGFTDTTAYPTSAIVDARLAAEQVLEDACDTAFVPRYDSYSFNGNGYMRGPLVLPKNDVRLIRSATANGLALSAPMLANLIINNGHSVYGYGWPAAGRSTIRYEYGLDYPPMDVTFAALELATFLLPQFTSVAGVDPRTESIITDDGTMKFSLGRGRTGLPSVDRVIAAYAPPLVG